MKKNVILLLSFAVFTLMSFSEKPVQNAEVTNVGACCSSYVWYQGEQIEMVRVCGGSSTADYIGNCSRADDIRDAMLEMQ